MTEKEVEWSVHPAAKDRKKLIFSIISFVLTLLLLYFAGGVFWTVFGALVLFLTLYPFYVETKYIATEAGITIRRPLYKKMRKWGEFRRVKDFKNGILLSPYKKDTFLENFRGEFLLLNREDREKVVPFIKEFINEHGGADKDS